ncbi:MAG: hypothetical protein WDM86_10190 [Rhizomicrobium sp.]
MTRFGVCASLALVGFLFATAAPAASPDRMAWDVFAAMTAPAGAPGVKAVAFETWASDDDIYSGKSPKWPAPGAKHLTRSLAAVSELLAVHGAAAPPADCLPKDGKAGNFPPGACIGEEVQHNRPVFQYIVANNLYSTAGLAAAYGATKPIDFPKDSIVVKADWVLIADLLRWLPYAYRTAADVRRAYYTNTATMNGRAGEYALVGMSVQSKALPQWLWMTFEHRSNPGRCDIIGCHDDFGALLANLPSRLVPNTDYGPCLKTLALVQLFASRHLDPVWTNYCLKGTQVAFGTAAGPTILANSVIERMNKGVPVPDTSCITCHAYSAFDKHGAPNYAVLPKRPVGPVNPALLHCFKTHDYLWSILAAH